ncbi:hypothetical protein ONZ51_g4230 [Trametes cubensis]|uniref:LysM domain-containing protein n=1 Tax=Trametes cubensis TaxID=1111947 RepID=A0AAD7XC86_9APHY|nr:hypothetical protein ONZ51_g4230 [Trametes cubensis]
MLLSSLLATIVSAIVVTSVNAQQPQCSRTHIVGEGEICDDIAEKTSTPTLQILNANLGVIDPACENLEIGRSICLGFVGQDCSVVHVVQSDDTCDKIADDAGTSVAIILANNANINGDCTNLVEGDVLCASGSLIAVLPFDMK